MIDIFLTKNYGSYSAYLRLPNPPREDDELLLPPREPPPNEEPPPREPPNEEPLPNDEPLWRGALMEELLLLLPPNDDEELPLFLLLPNVDELPLLPLPKVELGALCSRLLLELPDGVVEMLRRVPNDELLLDGCDEGWFTVVRVLLSRVTREPNGWRLPVCPLPKERLPVPLPTRCGAGWREPKVCRLPLP